MQNSTLKEDLTNWLFNPSLVDYSIREIEKLENEIEQELLELKNLSINSEG